LDQTEAWFSAVRRGDFQAAWRISDHLLARRARTGANWRAPRHEQSVWDGREVTDQTVLVRCYHGLGDTIQFARFLPRLKFLARDVIVWAQPALVRLLRTMPDGGRVLPLHDGTPEVEYDLDLEIMELAHMFRVDMETLPPQATFDVPVARRLSDRFSVGLMAQSGGWDPRRSIKSDMLVDTVSDIAGTALFSLQRGEPVPRTVDAQCADILTLATRLRGLDLVVTVDTMLAHLAATLGVPTWTLLPYEADWRWLVDRVDSPWYPSMRLFRQPSPGDWHSVLADVRSSLACARSR
jgi:hypothetical protein